MIERQKSKSETKNKYEKIKDKRYPGTLGMNLKTLIKLRLFALFAISEKMFLIDDIGNFRARDTKITIFFFAHEVILCIPINFQEFQSSLQHYEKKIIQPCKYIIRHR